MLNKKILNKFFKKIKELKRNISNKTKFIREYTNSKYYKGYIKIFNCLIIILSLFSTTKYYSILLILNKWKFSLLLILIFCCIYLYLGHSLFERSLKNKSEPLLKVFNSKEKITGFLCMLFAVILSVHYSWKIKYLKEFALLFINCSNIYLYKQRLLGKTIFDK